jgi:hypothetical protein
MEKWEHEEILEKLKKETEENNDIQKTSQIVEHPFETIKRSFRYTYFFGEGLESVNAETALICVAYNLKKQKSKKFRKLSSYYQLTLSETFLFL